MSVCLTGSHVPDAIGSIVIGGLLGTVATFMIWSNTNNLVGRWSTSCSRYCPTFLSHRSIPADRIAEINRELEGDIMVRQVGTETFKSLSMFHQPTNVPLLYEIICQVYDVKGIDMGNGLVRYKAEIDFDGRELARSYLDR